MIPTMIIVAIIAVIIIAFLCMGYVKAPPGYRLHHLWYAQEAPNPDW